jgi:Zn-dependent protease with chaperone function
MANALPIIGSVIGTAAFGLGGLVAQGLNLALLAWVRNSELTADRAGLLVVQETNPVIGSLMKISGIPKRYYGVVTINQFIEQARAFKGFDASALDKVAKAICIMDAAHPWSVMRASEILKWVESGECKLLLDNF